MGITTLIAEGEPRTRDVLKGLCTKRSDLDVVAQVECGAAAIDVIESTRRRQFDDLIDVAVARRTVTPAQDAQPSSFAIVRRGGDRLLIGERAHRFHFLELHSVDYLEVDGNY